jgi:hypothetical protein
MSEVTDMKRNLAYAKFCAQTFSCSKIYVLFSKLCMLHIACQCMNSAKLQ